MIVIYLFIKHYKEKNKQTTNKKAHNKTDYWYLDGYQSRSAVDCQKKKEKKKKWLVSYTYTCFSFSFLRTILSCSFYSFDYIIYKNKYWTIVFISIANKSSLFLKYCKSYQTNWKSCEERECSVFENIEIEEESLWSIAASVAFFFFKNNVHQDNSIKWLFISTILSWKNTKYKYFIWVDTYVFNEIYKLYELSNMYE